MQLRRVRLGDILDDYCPRERRVTNHAVVAMIEDEVKQTRCTTCDAEHEYKQARVPAARRRRPEGVLNVADTDSRPGLIAPDDGAPEDAADESLEPPAAAFSADEPSATPVALEAAPATEDLDTSAPADSHDEWLGNRRLIRATLPRPEGHVPERKEPEFTMRQGRFDGNRSGQRHNRGGHRRHAQGAQGGHFGSFGPRPAGQGGDRNGNRAPQGGRGGRQGGQGGPRQGGGRKRGR